MKTSGVNSEDTLRGKKTPKLFLSEGENIIKAGVSKLTDFNLSQTVLITVDQVLMNCLKSSF